jgi:cytidylate kinase
MAILLKLSSRPSGEVLVKIISAHSIVYAYDESAYILIDGVEVTAQLKSAAIDRAASLVSVHAAMRDEVLRMQQAIACDHDCVVEGRDAGTVVFPHAEYHFFLTAPVAVRAARWQQDQERKARLLHLISEWLKRGKRRA